VVGLGKGRVVLYGVVSFGKGWRKSIFCGEIWERTASW
jgi:hypothetical protein